MQPQALPLQNREQHKSLCHCPARKLPPQHGKIVCRNHEATSTSVHLVFIFLLKLPQEEQDVLQDLSVWTPLTPSVGSRPEVQVHIGRAHHSAPVFISPVAMPACLLLKNLPDFDNKFASKLAGGRVSSEIFDKTVFLKLDPVITFQ